MYTPEQAKALEEAGQAALKLEGMRADLSDPRGYGNAFVDVWNWIKRKLHGKAH